MNFQINGVRVIANVVHSRGGIQHAAGHVVRVLQTNQRCLRIVINVRPNHRFDQRPRENAVFAARDTRHATGHGRHGRQFVQIYMTALFTDHFVAVMCPHFDRDEVTHAARRDK